MNVLLSLPKLKASVILQYNLLYFVIYFYFPSKNVGVEFYGNLKVSMKMSYDEN